MKLNKTWCPRCGCMIVNGEHFGRGANTGEWTDEEIVIALKTKQMVKEKICI